MNADGEIDPDDLDWNPWDMRPKYVKVHEEEGYGNPDWRKLKKYDFEH